jgi:hypothetical protein
MRNRTANLRIIPINIYNKAAILRNIAPDMRTIALDTRIITINLHVMAAILRIIAPNMRNMAFVMRMITIHMRNDAAMLRIITQPVARATVKVRRCPKIISPCATRVRGLPAQLSTIGASPGMGGGG